MDEKEVSGIASAVVLALSKLNANANAPKEEVKGEGIPKDVFKCPDCGGEVVGSIKYCQHCGCELEWED